jgi:hypothetical protein
MDTAVFYGYAAMFWKNLRQPPPGFEDDLIFDHCLRWIKLFRSRCADLNDDMARSFRQMGTYRQKVMLLEEAFHSTDNDDSELGRLLVTLRHGRPGLEAAIGFMANWLYTSRRDSAGRSISARLPAALNQLFHTIKTKLPVESPAVQQTLRKFIHDLQENFRSNGIDRSGSSIQSSEQLRFAVRRTMGLVDGMAASLA